MKWLKFSTAIAVGLMFNVGAMQQPQSGRQGFSLWRLFSTDETCMRDMIGIFRFAGENVAYEHKKSMDQEGNTSNLHNNLHLGNLVMVKCGQQWTLEMRDQKAVTGIASDQKVSCVFDLIPVVWYSLWPNWSSFHYPQQGKALRLLGKQSHYRRYVTEFLQGYVSQFSGDSQRTRIIQTIQIVFGWWINTMINVCHGRDEESRTFIFRQRQRYRANLTENRVPTCVNFCKCGMYQAYEQNIFTNFIDLCGTFDCEEQVQEVLGWLQRFKEDIGKLGVVTE